MQSTMMIRSLQPYKGFLHACMIPLILGIVFHSAAAAVGYILFAASIYSLILRDKRGSFFFSLGMSALIGTIGMGSLLVSAAAF